MQPLPFGDLAAVLLRYPLAVISLILFTIALHRLANRYGCYGLLKNLLFGLACGVVAAALYYSYLFLSRRYGLHSAILAQIVTGYGAAVFVTVMRRFVFAQRPPAPSTDKGSA